MLMVFMVALGVLYEARAQTEPRAGATGSISGNLTISGKPARGVKVVALQGDVRQTRTIAAVRTDGDGHYQFRDIPAGNCRVSVDAPAFAGDPDDDYSTKASKTIKLEAGESVEGIDLEIAPGAVITGRVTETRGRPVIGEPVQIVPFKEGRDEDYLGTAFNDVMRVHTDDRGVYRAYGLPAGRYKVKVGDGGTKIWFGRVPLPKSYHPGVTDSSKAEVIEVAAGSEAIDIDIKVDIKGDPSPASKAKKYAVTGRIVDAQSGRPLPNVGFHYHSDISSIRSHSGIPKDLIDEFGDSDSKGAFRISDLPFGKYVIEVIASVESPWFTEEVEFEVADSDIRGLELKVHPAGSISGVVLLENSSDAAVVARISQLKIANGLSSYSGVPVNRDGSFRLTGLRPGVQSLSFAWTSNNSGGFEILRVERDGAQLDKTEQMLRGIRVGPGENVTGVRVFIAHYVGVVRGQIKIEGGALPSGGHLEISATPVNQPRKDTAWTRSKRLTITMSRWRQGTVDARGRFVIDRLPPGEYEINLDAYLTPWKDDEKDDEEPLTVTRLVTVSDTGEVQLDLVLDLSKTQPRK
jgi:hypothetical protein